MNGLYYLAEANLYLGVFYLAYCLFLNRNTHYQLSRAYLIFSCIVAFILPFVQVSALRPVKAAEPVYTLRPIKPAEPVSTVGGVTPVIRPMVKVAERHQSPVVHAAPAVIERHFTWQDALLYAYLIGATVLLVILFIKLYALFKMTRNEQTVNEGKYRVIYLNETDVVFSFFNYLFIGDNAAGANTIIRHELVHIRQKHSADIILLELLKIINWFNPFVYLVQNSLRTIHEYIADEQTAAHESDALTYASFLLNNAYGVGGSSITHSFFNYNLLKKRIVMLNQQRSGNLAKLKYLVTIPICVALLCTSTLLFSKTYGWVDLAPAGVKSPGKYAMLNAKLTQKRKLLKITENGVTTIANQLSLDQQNKKVAYTAATITRADSLLLLKNHNIKVEVVVDSTRFTTKDGRLILPVINVDGYYLMDHFLHNNVLYTTAKGDKGGLVEVGFALDKDRRITNARIVKSGGAKLDALALNGFNAYKGIVTDAPGKNYKIGVYFFTDDYSIFKTDSLGNDPEFAGELIITNYKYPVNRTSKGYEYDESGVGFPGDNNNMAHAKVLIYDKNGEANWYYKNKCTPDDLKLLQDKYGYTFPSGASSIIQFMHPKDVKNKRLAYIFDVTSYLDAPYADQFYNYMLNNTEFPKQAQRALSGGAVVLNFNLDNNGMISDIIVAQSAGNGFDEAAVSALQSYKSAINDNAGKHSIAVLFCVAENKYRPVVSEKIKKDGYVGELAICDAKSPFINGTAKFIPPASAPASQKN
ncbi:TonB family protein [Mucilaginibacter sp. OK098]|uniref:TonB family protein n=1 Tax=Mucilaginibacter sp. OK098 TaxID=1855297 RepID=UPI000918DF9F|nr:TonB family protein [Mucilaginibacter sp. OK098]SHN12338.1 TonB family C-terminal domain-containing protein [Mucilaginibacter sp. OK098]